MRILVFGDSIVYGGWDTEGGWVDRLKRGYHRQYVSSGGKDIHEIINLGIGGDTSSRIRDRLRAEIEFRSQGSSHIVLIFSFGTNDARIINDDIATTTERFRENVSAIATTAQAYSDRVMFVGLPPLSQPKLEFPEYESEFRDSLVQQYDDELAKIVEKAGLLYVPTRPVFERHGLEGLYSFDGLHPKDEGHQLLHNIVHPELTKLLQ
jgi:lysophospholipase L1-like esterase